MNKSPIICFGQQPCGFFPKRFLFAKMQTARKLQAEIGGEIVFFCHDSDHDPRETQTILRHRKTREAAILNFSFVNKLQRKFSPLGLKQILDGRLHIGHTVDLQGVIGAKLSCQLESGTIRFDSK